MFHRPAGGTMSERRHIGSYRIIERLGSGGAGDVFLATPIQDKSFASAGELVSIKLYNQRVLSAPNQLDRIRREFEIGSNLNHPHLVHMHECNIDDVKNPFLVMEYIDGMPLSEWLQMFHPVSEALTLRTLIRIAQGIKALHDAKTIHRDIKPENIMMSSDFLPKLMDFGVVHIEHRDGETPSDSFIGTIRNASPEWLRGEDQEHDLRSDLYSFGTVIYAMLHGHQVFAEEKQFARLVELVTATKPRVDEGLRNRQQQPTPTLLKLAESLLEKDPAARPATIDEVLQVLKDGETTTPAIRPLHGYMATALTGVPEDARKAIAFESASIASVCKQFDVYVYQPRKATDPLLHPDVEPEVVYVRDRKRVLTADLLIIDADYPSFGVGQEIEIAGGFGVPTIIIRHENAKTKLSRMVTGSPLNLIGDLVYRTPEDLATKLRAIVGDNLERIRAFKDSIRPKLPSKIGFRLRAMRNEAGLGIDEAALKIGTSTRLIQQIEERPLKYHNAGLHIIGRLLAAYGKTPAELFGEMTPVTTRAVETDRNLRTLENVARTARWSAQDYFELRDEYERTLAASGDTERVGTEKWLQRHTTLEKRRLRDGRAKASGAGGQAELFEA
jgi:serine/threonine protein kinase/transcriptional regulator with XRE-family HTH domain